MRLKVVSNDKENVWVIILASLELSDCNKAIFDDFKFNS